MDARSTLVSTSSGRYETRSVFKQLGRDVAFSVPGRE